MYTRVANDRSMQILWLREGAVVPPLYTYAVLLSNDAPTYQKLWKGAVGELLIQELTGPP
jgi:hypothetical protein